MASSFFFSLSLSHIHIHIHDRRSLITAFQRILSFAFSLSFTDLVGGGSSSLSHQRHFSLTAAAPSLSLSLAAASHLPLTGTEREAEWGVSESAKKPKMEAKSIKAATVNSLQAVKRNCGKSYGQIAAETGLTNVYVAQLFRRQAQLNPDTAPKLRSALPELPEDLLQEMMRPPVRSYDPNLIQDPTVYRLNEAIMHFGESIKEIINEEFGDGIMSAIDFYCSVDKVKGVDGKDRVVLTFDGKYLPYTEQKTEHMVSRSRLQGN